MTRGTFLENEPMSRHTSFRIGGPARAYAVPKDKNDLVEILRFTTQYQIPTYFVGSGTNLLVSDAGVDGLVITLGKSFNQLEFDGNNVSTDAGVMLGKLVKECIHRNLSGLESLIGVPGTLGGALVMNAGAYGSEISNMLKEVNVLTLTGEEKKYRPGDIKFSYRHSTFPADEIIIKASFELVESDRETILNKKMQASSGRKSSQPLKFRSGGSVFKNPPTESAAGYLIDQVGLKGAKSGDAEISPKHANFFVNHGRAKAEDVVQLIRLARKKVFDRFGILLDLEIKTIGFTENTFEI